MKPLSERMNKGKFYSSITGEIIDGWVNEVAKLEAALRPLAYAKRARWHNADSSTPPYVVSESAVKKALEALEE